jgi:chemotaxis protein MotA
MVVEGLVMLAEKKTPRFMQDRLNSFLEPQNHFNIDKQLRGSVTSAGAAPLAVPAAKEPA